jgi:hypothetical protein
MRVHTVPYARVGVTLYVLARRPRLLARMQGSASKRGQFTIRAVLTNRVTKPVQALLSVTVRAGCGKTARRIQVTIQPGHHRNRVRHKLHGSARGNGMRHARPCLVGRGTGVYPRPCP